MLSLVFVVLGQVQDEHALPQAPTSMREVLYGIVTLIGMLAVRELTYWVTHYKDRKHGGGNDYARRNGSTPPPVALSELRSLIVDTDRNIKRVREDVHDMAGELGHFAQATEHMNEREMTDHEDFKMKMQSVKETVDRIERAIERK